MKRTLIIPAIIIGLLVGCRPEENPEQLRAVNQSLEYANGVMQEANDRVYEEFIEKKKDVLGTGLHAEVWGTKASQIGKFSDSLRSFIKAIKVGLIKQSDSLKIDYVDLTKQLHSSDGVGQQLLNRLAAFKDTLPEVINSDPIYFDKALNGLLRTVPLLSGYREGLTADQKRDYGRKWLEESFGHSSSLMAMIILNKLINDVLVTEKTCIDYCNSNIAIDAVIYNKTAVIASLSSSYVKAGETLELTVGIGKFTDELKPRITIEGKEVKINDDAVVVHKFIADGTPGKHKIPITIEYDSPNGMQERVWKNIVYVVAEN